MQIQIQIKIQMMELPPGGRSFERADENGTKMKYLTKLTILFIYSKFA